MRLRPKPVRDRNAEYEEQYGVICQAVKENAIALVKTSRETGEPAYLLCAYVKGEGGTMLMTPLAELIDPDMVRAYANMPMGTQQ